jgi:hypothetical protein
MIIFQYIISLSPCLGVIMFIAVWPTHMYKLVKQLISLQQNPKFKYYFDILLHHWPSYSFISNINLLFLS